MGSSRPTYKYAHKLFEPRAHRGAISREALLARLFGEDPARVVLLQGPAGHGKSTLLQQAMVECRAQGWITGWFTADEADNDPRRLAMHLDALLASMEAEQAAPASAPAATAVDSGARPDRLLARLVELGRPVALFLDDFQAIASRPVQAYFRQLLDQLPEPVRVFIASRSMPDIGLARLVVNHSAVVLRAEDLRFTPEELRRFFAGAQDLAVGEDELAAIYRKTEGWPAAIQLFRLALASPSVRRSLADLGTYRPRELADYLADNVLALQDAEVQQFLLRSSPLARLSGELCDEVLERRDSQALLQGLERSGLFVRNLDSESRWYAYHALFAEILREQLRADDPAGLRRIHRRAASWFQRQGAHEDAMQHAVAAGDHALAAEVLETWSGRLIALGQLVTVERWYETLPLDEVARRPGLTVKVAWALCFLRRHQKLEPIRALLRQLPAGASGEGDPDIVLAMLAVLDDDIAGQRGRVERIDLGARSASGFQAFELGAAANVRGYIALAEGELEQAREVLALASAHGERAGAHFSLGYSVGTLGMNLMIRGQLPEALERFRVAALQGWAQQDDSAASAVLAACHVGALYAADQLDAAAARFERSREAIANVATLDYVAVAYIARARIHEARGETAQAAELLDQAEQLAHVSLWPRLLRMVGWERVRSLLVRGEVDRAQAVASRITPTPAALPPDWIPLSEDTEGELVGRARLDLHAGRASQALASVAAALLRAQRQGRVQRQIRLHLLEALAHDRLQAEAAAQRSLLRALGLAQPGGYLRYFLDEGPLLLGLLRRLRGQPVLPREPAMAPLLLLSERLLEAGGEGESRRSALPEFLALEPLTEREKRILVLLANGVSNEEMAQRMFVSRNTIKFHLKNIYSKLAVNSRLQAINAARAMGLIA